MSWNGRTAIAQVVKQPALERFHCYFLQMLLYMLNFTLHLHNFILIYIQNVGIKNRFLRILMKMYDMHINIFYFPLLSCISLLLLIISCSAGMTCFILQDGY
jgi:hypothetical protein